MITHPNVDRTVFMTGIEAVTFDLWDTLIQELPGGAARVVDVRVTRIAEILSSARRPYSTEAIETAHAETGLHLGSIWDEARDVSVSYQVRFMLDRLDEGLSEAVGHEAFRDILAAYSESMLLHPPKLMSGAREALSQVRDLVPELGLISNTGKTPGSVLREIMSRMDILRFFDTTTFSDEMSVRKPGPEIFLKTLKDMGVEPADAVHVGDDPLTDIQGAQNVGMRTVHVASGKEIGSVVADMQVSSLAEVVSAIESLREQD